MRMVSDVLDLTEDKETTRNKKKKKKKRIDSPIIDLTTASYDHVDDSAWIAQPDFDDDEFFQ